MEKQDIKSLDYNELGMIMKEMGEKPFRSKQIYQWLHKRGVDSFEEMSDVSKDLRNKLSALYEVCPLTLAGQRISGEDGTGKYLFRLSDGKVIESVLMKYKHGNSVCISSQAGCRMGCRFCASTLDGLERNLSPSEMLSQIYKIQSLSRERVSNVVVMGTGEPLDNFDNLVKFIRMASDEHGLNISQRNITVSTCGLVPQIYELADLKLQITLAVSLHGPNDLVRRELMPVANAFSIEELLKACRYYYEKTGRRLTFEYSLCKGVNDREEYAKELSSLLKGLNCHVNLIPVNPVKERNYTHSAASDIQKFKFILEKNRINVTIRREMGSDIDAACGQLRKRYMDENTK